MSGSSKLVQRLEPVQKGRATGAGEVAVRVEPESSEDDEQVLHFAVMDTSIGIPSDKQRAIFEAFTGCAYYWPKTTPSIKLWRYASWNVAGTA